MFFARALLFFSVALSAHALATPHIARAHHHRAISARLVAAEADAPQPIQPLKLSKRCKPHSSDPDQSPSSTPAPSKAHHHSTSEPNSATAPPPEHTTPTPSPHPSTTSEAAPTTTHKSSGGSGNLPSFMVGTQTGQGTYYATGLGACGITNNDGQPIAAVSHLLFDAFPGYLGVNPNSNPVCGRQVKVKYQGKEVVVTITDRCTGCKLTDLDFSPSAFNTLADPNIGRIDGIEWSWVSEV